MDWTTVKIEVDTKDYSAYEAFLLKYVSGVVIEDPQATLAHIQRGEWEAHGFEEAKLLESWVTLILYLENDTYLIKRLGEISVGLKNLAEKRGESYHLSTDLLEDKDWANEWKRHYKVLSFGQKIEIVPIWLTPSGTRPVVIKVNPGLAFGTGYHETTALPLSLLEGYIKEGMSVFDIGTGSGILALCAKKLGASKVTGYDYDPVAIRTAQEMAELNEETDVAFYVSDLFEQVEGKADFVMANIVTPILLKLLPDLSAHLAENGKALLSGIALETAPEMKSALTKYNYKIIEEKQNGEWLALVVERA